MKDRKTESRKTESRYTGSPEAMNLKACIGRRRAGDLGVITGCRKAEDVNKNHDSRRKSG